MPHRHGAATKHPGLAYRDASLSAEARTEALLQQMTLEEKAAQMQCVWNEKREKLLDPDGNFDLARARKHFGHGHGIGQVGRPSDSGKGKNARDMAVLTNAIQKFFLEQSRLGIPVIFHEECLHGHAARDATSFCQPIGLAATFDTALVERLYTMTALEARVRGTHQALTPVVDVARDPRWGRVEETFGEDPYLVTQMGMAAVRGFQGDRTFTDATRVMATLKHFVAHGSPENGLNCAPANISERILRETFLTPFEWAIRKAGAISVMPSYNEVDGLPSHANVWLLRDVLRGEWGFDGFTSSDYYALWELADRPDTHGHHVATDKREAARLAVQAGVNIELPEPDAYLHLVDLVKSGELHESDLDDLVRPMLYWKFRFGLFDRPYVDPDVAERTVASAPHRELALEAARSTITLLKNAKKALPLNRKKIKTLAVIGPNAARMMIGGYSGVPKYGTSVLQGITDLVGDRVTIHHAKGCDITKPGSWQQDPVVQADSKKNAQLIKDAVKVARKCDAIVLCIGENEQTSREAWSKVHLGDRASLDLIGEQLDLAKALVATKKPVIVVLNHGRPNSIPWLAEHVAAILECWYLGQDGGRAVAEVIFGDVNPGGKLPMSVPRSVGHLPSYYNHRPSARRPYLFDDVSPLYAFGYGLSYTTFRLENVRLEKSKMGNGESTEVRVDITNTGKREGTEVVQMYIRDLVSSVTRPVKELKGFVKVRLKPGERRTVAIPITPESLEFWNVRLQRVVEPGEFRIMVGTSSRDEDLQAVTLTVESGK